MVYVTATASATPLHPPTETPTATPRTVLASGTGKLKAFINEDSVVLSYFDLDTGENRDDKTSDLEFYVTCGSACWPVVQPRNGAISFVFGSREPTYEDCAENMFSDDYEYSDSFVCYRTNSGNISVFKIIMYCGNTDGSIDGSIDITFLYRTWE
jgi:hypothetical protein